ncbi:hypothetical protein IWW55_003996 [Coemansia sp. RSA 2706]|nr:hypothetical protein IWW55_003996 [Coemansia sp. RSA 2706]KAJ2326417.1 hypothetical protein IWW51_002285 [Coemansia sp. RSA 2702]KAJ2365504.1 hypothetical protein H4S01_003212 [Coemansia sp. RSA 2610]KAJ2388179.1 hypothetical protein H4S02_002999 [Coemansia sp. RSA 2611]
MKFSLATSLIAAALVSVHASPNPQTPKTIVGGDALVAQKADMNSLVAKADDLAASASADQNAQAESLNSVAGLNNQASGGDESAIAIQSSSTDDSGNVVIVTEIVTVTAGTETAAAPDASNETAESEAGDSVPADSQTDSNTVAAEDLSTEEPSGISQEETADTAQGTSANDGEASAPGESSAPTVESSAPTVESSASADYTTAPAEESPSAAPAEESPSAPAEESPSAPAEESSSGGGNDGSSGDTYTGDGTFYTPGLGSCGKTNTEADLIAAINAPQYGSNANPNQAEVCGKCALVKGPKGEVKVTITDRCPVCKSGDLDLSPAAFNQIGDADEGRISISWSFVSC